MNPKDIPPFSELNLAEPILKAISDIGYEVPSPIQAACIPPLLEGKDIVGQAQTGTGKTAAFALPLLSRIDLSIKQPQLLVLAPTRELAIQVAEAIQNYAHHMKGLHVLPVYGGQGMGHQLKMLQRGIHVIVGTPGRVIDHIKRKTLKLDKLSCLVLDEADEMLRMGFIDDVEEVLSASPDDRQVALFSATMPRVIRQVAQKYLNDPIEISIKAKTATVDTIKQRYWLVSGASKLDAMTRILESEEIDAMIVFVRTKTATVELAEKLEARGFSSSPLNGDMNQQHRESTIDRLKQGQLDILVATDVAARGLDVPRISHILNYDVPHDTESYVHRIGRTGRAGRKGDAILFVAPRERRMLNSIERATRQPLERMNLPTYDELNEKRVSRFTSKISDTLEAQELSFFKELIKKFHKESGQDILDIAAALTFIAQKERPLISEKPKHEPRQERNNRNDSRNDNRRERSRDRNDRNDRNDRGREQNKEARKPRERKPKSDIPMDTFRIEVGRDHNVAPGNIVGAIANEAGLDHQHIGHIKLHDDFSTVDLPKGMPKEVFAHLRKVWVCGQQLKISEIHGAQSPSSNQDGKQSK